MMILEYIKLLRNAFGGYAIMPEQTKVQAFIEAYSLFADWGIIAYRRKREAILFFGVMLWEEAI